MVQGCFTDSLSVDEVITSRLPDVLYALTLILQGRFIVDDPHFKWLTALKSPQSELSRSEHAQGDLDGDQRSLRHRFVDLYVTLACGCLKGALFHLNMACSVVGMCSKSPACTPLHSHHHLIILLSQCDLLMKLR
jgi:hypothetical protein